MAYGNHDTLVDDFDKMLNQRSVPMYASIFVQSTALLEYMIRLGRLTLYLSLFPGGILADVSLFSAGS